MTTLTACPRTTHTKGTPVARLSKQEAKLHREACELVELHRDLTEDEKEFVLDHWQESNTATHNLDGAFFTPAGLARDLAIEVSGDRVIDLCAGIGRLAWSCRDFWGRRWNNEPPREFVCVERNPEYVKVGRKVLPEATWVGADVLDVPELGLGRFDTAISNPPFGSIARSGDSPTYRGRRFEYHVIAVAAQLATYGAFIIPQLSAPFRFSGERCYREERDGECLRFERQTGIRMGCGAGFETSIYRGDWRGVAPRVEVVTCDFDQVRPERPHVDQVDVIVPTAAIEVPPVARPRAGRPVTDLQLPLDV